MTDITDITPRGDEQAQALRSVGWLSYVLHLIVAVGAIIPGAQAGALLLVVALWGLGTDGYHIALSAAVMAVLTALAWVAPKKLVWVTLWCWPVCCTCSLRRCFCCSCCRVTWLGCWCRSGSCTGLSRAWWR